MGYTGRTEYVGGSVGFVDYCDSDELSVIELCSMVGEFGQTFSAINFYIRVNGFIKLQTDSDVMTLHTLLDKDRVVKVYSVEEKLSEVYVGTQESQVGRPIKSKRIEV